MNRIKSNKIDPQNESSTESALFKLRKSLKHDKELPGNEIQAFKQVR